MSVFAPTRFNCLVSLSLSIVSSPRSLRLIGAFQCNSTQLAIVSTMDEHEAGGAQRRDSKRLVEDSSCLLLLLLLSSSS